MPPVVFSTTSIVELEQFMVQHLCNHEKLDALQAHAKRSLIRQSSEIIGVGIRVEGPRLMRSQAIWAERENRVLFYDSAGRRFAIVKLAESPALETAIDS